MEAAAEMVEVDDDELAAEALDMALFVDRELVLPFDVALECYLLFAEDMGSVG